MTFFLFYFQCKPPYSLLVFNYIKKNNQNQLMKLYGEGEMTEFVIFFANVLYTYTI